MKNVLYFYSNLGKCKVVIYSPLTLFSVNAQQFFYGHWKFCIKVCPMTLLQGSGSWIRHITEEVNTPVSLYMDVSRYHTQVHCSGYWHEDQVPTFTHVIS